MNGRGKLIKNKINTQCELLIGIFYEYGGDGERGEAL